MDSNTIFTKTAKGLGEATGKTSALSRKLRNILKEIDGKKKVIQLQDDLGDYSASELNQFLRQLLDEEYIREFVHPTASESPPMPRTFVQPKVVEKKPVEESLSGESLDFTRLAREASKSLTTDRANKAKPANPAPPPAAVPARKNYVDGDSLVTAEAEIKAAIQAKETAKREAEEKAKRESEEKARREAEERARREAEEKARREAEEKVKREAEEKARREAEERARREAEEKARREAEERVRREAEEKARRDAEEKAKREAEEKARREAEEKARREAEERAEKARREAEERARREVEEKARREAEEKAKREAEEKARREAEERARREAEEKARREAEEKAKREAEEKVRREAEEKAKREAEEVARKEAEKKARLEAEELAQQKAEEEIRAAIQAKERARREAEEEKARRKAEENARREAEEKAKREAEETARKEAEEAAQKAAEEKARREAEEEKARKDAEAEAAREAEEQARQAEKEREREAKEAEKALIAAAKAAQPPKPPGYWGRKISGAVIAVVVVGFALVHLMPFDEQRGQIEKIASAGFRHPVTIKSLHFSMMPKPHWRIEGVTVGSEGQIKIQRVDAGTALGAVFGSVDGFTDLRLDTVTLNEEGLAWLLFGKPQQPGLKAVQASAKNIKLDSKNIVMPLLDAKLEIGGDGKWQKIALESVEKKIAIELQPMPDAVKIDFSAGAYALPFGSSVLLDDFHANGVASASELVVSDFSGHLLGGTLGGSANLKWGSTWSLSGEMVARSLDAPRLATGMVEEGKLDGKAQYAFRANDPEKLFATQHLEGNFVVRKGALLGANFGSILQSGESAGGKTPFSEAVGSFVVDNGVVQLRQFRLSAGKVSATGTARMEADKKLRGRLALELKTAVAQRSASINLTGTLGEPHYNR